MEQQREKENLRILEAIENKNDFKGSITPLGLDIVVGLGFVEVADEAEIDRQNALVSKLPSFKESLKKLKEGREECKKHPSAQVNVLPMTETICLAEKEISLLKIMEEGLGRYLQVAVGKFVRLTEKGREFLANGIVAA